MARNKNSKNRKGSAVPKGRLSRLMGLGGTVASIAGSAAAKGAKEFASGNRPKAQDLLLTPGNAMKLTKRLSKMRGAAMKIGQMLSMESGDLLPREFADVLSKLRAEARHMPYSQLEAVLFENWDEDWPEQFHHFNHFPVAAASIGQVHRAILKSDEVVAIKIQYPGVRDSIDSDISNVASLVKMSGLLPADLNIDPIIEEARVQLHQEADYEREAEFMERFNTLLAGDPGFWVPDYFPDQSTDKILTMSYVPGEPIETLAEHHSQELRDDVAGRLMQLLHRELYEFRLMQTDPNFANYQYYSEDDQIVLLDFGAAREISPDISDGYRTILGALVAGDVDAVFASMQAIGFLPETLPEDIHATIKDMIELAIKPMSTDAIFDFGNNPIVEPMRDMAMPLANQKELWYAPPPETVFIQRKIAEDRRHVSARHPSKGKAEYAPDYERVGGLTHHNHANEYSRPMDGGGGDHMAVPDGLGHDQFAVHIENYTNGIDDTAEQ